MADFCRQCTVDHFGPEYADRNDLKGITTPEDWAKDLAAVVICEGCGFIQVDPDGVCISNDCMVNHDTGELRRTTLTPES